MDAVSEFQRQEDQQASSAPEGQALIAKGEERDGKDQERQEKQDAASRREF